MNVWKEAWKSTPRWLRVIFVYSYIVGILVTLLVIFALFKYVFFN